MVGVKPKELAERLVAEARTTVLDRFGSSVENVFHYGAVDIDQDHLVVWVLLKGPADTLPEWYFPGSPDPELQWHHQKTKAGVAEELLTTVDEIHAAVVEIFRGHWPDADNISIGFDSGERVADNGGFLYFKG